MKTVMKVRRDTSHGFHLMLTLFTCGMWAFTGWPIMILWNKFGPRKRAVARTRG